MILKKNFLLLVSPIILFQATKIFNWRVRWQGKLLEEKNHLPHPILATHPHCHSAPCAHNFLPFHFAASITPSQSFNSIGPAIPLTIYHQLFSLFTFTFYPAENPKVITMTFWLTVIHFCSFVTLLHFVGKLQSRRKHSVGLQQVLVSKQLSTTREGQQGRQPITPNVLDHRLQWGFHDARQSYVTGWHAFSATIYLFQTFFTSFNQWTSVPPISAATHSWRLCLLLWRSYSHPAQLKIHA